MSHETTDIESQARKLFERQSLEWTGHIWDWTAASDEVKQRFIQHILDGSRPLSKAAS